MTAELEGLNPGARIRGLVCRGETVVVDVDVDVNRLYIYIYIAILRSRAGSLRCCLV